MMKWAKIYLGGLFMGAADIVPGVSGGTIAFILGFYERLINALSGVNKESISMLFRGDIKGLWKHFDLSFLLLLGAGILSSILLLSSVISYLLDEYALYLWGFFFGLIVASSYVLIKELDEIKLNQVLFIFIGIFFGYLLSIIPPSQGSDITFFVFLAGMISILAMLLPGVSGSFVLLMLGMYEIIINAINNFQFSILILFGSGAVLGLLLFSKVLKYILLHFRQKTISLLIGIIIGSLVKIWPWKEVVEWSVINGKHVPIKEVLIFPWYINNYHFMLDIFYPLLCLFLGFLFIFCFNYISLQKK